MPRSELAFALELADLADSLSLPRFRALDLRIETKPDLTPVTDADRMVEGGLRERIAASRPGEGVSGEEEGGDGGATRWVIDALVAEGSLDAAVDARLSPWDYVALVPVVEEAGGRVTALDGGRPRPKEQVVSSNGLLHNELLALLNRE
jgi:fructose-1,6-bisphosphatase/inositol monophosphatase family enzyme